MAIESTFVETPYGKFHVEATGQGKPVLFIHGGSASARRQRSAEIRRNQSAADSSEAAKEAAVDRTIASIFADPSKVPATFRDDLRWQNEQADPGQFGAVAEEFERIGKESYDRLTIPTLVVWGEADSMIPLANAQQLVAAIPGARYGGIPGVGHTCQIEAPKEFVAIVGPFLDETANA